MCLGIPCQILDAADPTTHRVTALVSGARRSIDVSLIEDEGVAPGDWALVHAGLALSKISEQEARDTLALLQEMSDVFLGGAPTSTSG
ncbi:MAG TPA: HypC/HybG/HupF family hydrogenase formation chaperone [Ktedonobacterales bacterium]